MFVFSLGEALLFKAAEEEGGTGEERPGETLPAEGRHGRAGSAR